MKINEMMPVILEVFKDWRAIVTIIVMLFFMFLPNKIINYKKRPRRNRKGKKGQKAPSPAPKKETPKQEDDEEPEEQGE